MTDVEALNLTCEYVPKALQSAVLAGQKAVFCRTHVQFNAVKVLFGGKNQLFSGFGSLTGNCCYAPISISIKKAAEAFIEKGKVISEGVLNRVEMAFRSYDPCLGCATHTLPGQMPLEVLVRDAEGNVVERLTQFIE